MNRLAPIFICWDNSIPPPCFFDGLTHGSNKVLLPNHLSFFHFRCFFFFFHSCKTDKTTTRRNPPEIWQGHEEHEGLNTAGELIRHRWTSYWWLARTAAGERDSLGERHLKSTDKTTPKPPLMELRKKWVILHPPCVISCLYESL